MRAFIYIFIIRSFALFPLPVVHTLAFILGHISYYIPSKTRKVAQINIGLCFPELSLKQQNKLLCQSIIETFKTVAETGAIWSWRRTRIEKLVKKTEGLHLIEEAHTNGKGVILSIPHCGAWELVGMYFSMQSEMTSMYRPPNVSGVDNFVRKARQRFGAQLVPTNAIGVKALLKALKNNSNIAILPDQDPGNEGNEFADFFSHSANTMTLLSKLAKKANAVVISANAERLPFGQGFKLVFESIDEKFEKSESVADANFWLNKSVEHVVRRNPAQYQWIYKRFKTRPPGEHSIY